ncbi:ubiquitin carboxyl-terminal hydrolase family protein, putative, partial [Ichthyophthirius multifiliis]
MIKHYPSTMHNNIVEFKKCYLRQQQVGLQNIGNTCYINSALQCLFNCSQLLEYFLQKIDEKEKNQKNKGVSDEFAKLIRKMATNNKLTPEYPSELKSSIEKICTKFKGNNQEDCQEFLRTLLENLNDDLNRVIGKKPYKELEADPKNQQDLQKISDIWFQYYKERDNSIITDIFTGQLLSIVSCLKCEKQSYAFDNFMDLSLSFTNNHRFNFVYELERLIEQFLKEEPLDNAYYCQKCKNHTKSKRRFEIQKLPDVLVIHIKRFYFGSIRKEKLLHKITFNIQNLDLRKFIKNSSNKQQKLYDKSVLDCTYDLIGIVNHMGGLHGGHYYAECKNPYDGTWNQFNDAICSEINILNKKYDTDGSSEPYMLFYQKRRFFLSKI